MPETPSNKLTPQNKPGSISKSLLTPCRRVGLSKKTRTPNTSIFLENTTPNSSLIETQSKPTNPDKTSSRKKTTRNTLNKVKPSVSRCLTLEAEQLETNPSPEEINNTNIKTEIAEKPPTEKTLNPNDGEDEAVKLSPENTNRIPSEDIKSKKTPKKPAAKKDQLTTNNRKEEVLKVNKTKSNSNNDTDSKTVSKKTAAKTKQIVSSDSDEESKFESLDKKEETFEQSKNKRSLRKAAPKKSIIISSDSEEEKEVAPKNKKKKTSPKNAKNKFAGDENTTKSTLKRKCDEIAHVPESDHLMINSNFKEEKVETVVKRTNKRKGFSKILSLKKSSTDENDLEDELALINSETSVNLSPVVELRGLDVVKISAKRVKRLESEESLASSPFTKSKIEDESDFITSTPLEREIPQEKNLPEEGKLKKSEKRKSTDLKNSSNKAIKLEKQTDLTDEEVCGDPSCKKPNSGSLDWIQCDGKCQKWYHMVCVGLFPEDLNESDDFICISCSVLAENYTVIV